MRELGQVVRWGIKSVGGLLANLGLLTVWVEYLAIPPEFAVGINWLLISLVGYVVTDKWVFGESESPTGPLAIAKQYLGMQSVMTVGKLLNYAIYVGLIHIGNDYRVAWASGAVVVFIATFLGNRYLWVTGNPTP